MKTLLRILFVSVPLVISGGCSMSGKSGEQKQYNDSARPIGYFSSDKQIKGNHMVWNDNHGPILKIMNQSPRESLKNSSTKNSGVITVKNENTLPNGQSEEFLKKNRINAQKERGTNAMNRQALDEARIRKAAASVNNVKDVQSVALGTSVLISVNLDDEKQSEKTKVRILKAVKPYLAGRACTIITDKGTFTRKINRHNDLIESGPR